MAGSAEPTRADIERRLLESMHDDMFPAVYFNFEPDRNDGRNFRVAAEYQYIVAIFLQNPRCTQKSKLFSDTIQYLPNGLWLYLNEINIFRIAR